MIARLKRAWSHHPVVTSGFLLAVAATIFFAIRSTVFMVYWADPVHQNRPIEGWMTPRYVVHSWQVEPDVLIGVIGDGPMPGKRQSFEDIARDRGISLDDLIARITLTVQNAQQDAE